MEEFYDDEFDYQLPAGVSTKTDTAYGPKVIGARGHVEKDSSVIKIGESREIVGSHIIVTGAPLVEDARVWVDGEETHRTVHEVKRASADGETVYEVRVA